MKYTSKHIFLSLILLVFFSAAYGQGEKPNQGDTLPKPVYSDTLGQEAWNEFWNYIYEDGIGGNSNDNLVPDVAPNSAWSVDEARKLIEEAQYDSARTILERYINYDSTDYEAWYLLGSIMNQKENLLLAMQYYYRSIAIDPYYSGPYIDLAYLFDIFAQYDSMNYYMRKAIESDEEPNRLYYDFGYSFDLLNQYDSALTYYHKALVSDPMDDMAFLNIGAIMGNFGNMDSAYFYTKRSFEINPDAPEASYNLGQILYAQGYGPEAIDLFQRSLALNPGKIEAKLYLGEIYESLGDTEMARIYYREFVDNAPLIYREDINRIKTKLGIE